MMPLSLPHLDSRLAGLASLVRQGARCADIGCDHGLLITYLAASGHIPSGYACDVNQKPLEKAAFSLRAYGLENRIKLFLCNGLSALSPGDCDDIVIAGMGGDLIWEIISAAPWTRNPNLRFILQPMTHPERLRQSLYENGFALLEERPLLSGRFVYSIMLAAYTGEHTDPSPMLTYGGLLWENDSPAAAPYFSRLANQLTNRCVGLRRKNDPQLAAFEQLLAQAKSRIKGENNHDSTADL